MSGSQAPLIVHIIYRLDVGGLENGLVNLINHLPPGRYRHAIICLTDYSDFSRRIRHPDVRLFALHKRPGQDPVMFWRVWRLLRTLKPAVVHTRNLAALECQLPAWLAGVRCRVHGEHGREVGDFDGSNRKYQLLRRALRPLVCAYVPMSRDLADYLREKIRVPSRRIHQIYSGVDTRRFQPCAERRELPPAGFATRDSIVIGTVGRLEIVKDQLTLVRAFIALLDRVPDARHRLRLVLVGDGSQRAAIEALIEESGVADRVWLAGSRDDVPGLLQCLDIFVLPSRGEGISNTILEAMASGLPVVATRVGGNSELVVDGETGYLVPAADPIALATALKAYVDDPALCSGHGRAACERVKRHFSLSAMVAAYQKVYDGQLAAAGGTLLNYGARN